MEEIIRYFDIYIYNFWSLYLLTDLDENRISKMRNLFLRLLLVNEHDLMNQIRYQLILNPEIEGFYLAINFYGNEFNRQNPYQFEPWNNQFIIEC